VIGVVLMVGVPAALLAYAATRSNTFRVQRDLSINAPPEKIFPLINDFHSWPSWSPYEKRDPGMKRTYSGAEIGKGAVYEWDGNDNVGKGRMEILDTAPPNKVLIKLDFIKPFEGHNTAEFTIVAEGASSKVTWAMYGPKNFLAKVMHCFIDIDKMCGKDFAEGLSNMKTVVEK
jgi:uncharacterized protein YndB with AHSA1/START domain